MLLLRRVEPGGADATGLPVRRRSGCSLIVPEGVDDEEEFLDPLGKTVAYRNEMPGCDDADGFPEVDELVDSTLGQYRIGPDHRSGDDGTGLPGAARRSRSPLRHQGDEPGSGRPRAADRRAVPGRGPRGGRPGPPEHRHGPQPGDRPGLPLHRDGAGRAPAAPMAGGHRDRRRHIAASSCRGASA